MGTRGVVGFVVDGQEKLAYNHWDSYPSALGRKVLAFLRPRAVDSLQPLIEQVRALQAVDLDGPAPTPEQIEKYQKYADTGVDDGNLTNWYVLLRKLQGDLVESVEAGVMIVDNNFARDSLFCEWGYVIDLDAKTLEVYRGFQQLPPTEGRWAGHLASGSVSGEEYFPIQRVRSYSLFELPDDQAMDDLEKEIYDME